MATSPRITSLMTNDEFDNWADIYVQARIGEIVSVSLSQFLQSPWTHLASAGQETAPECAREGFLPLLPAQAATSRRIQAEWAETPQKAAAPRAHLVLVPKG